MRSTTAYDPPRRAFTLIEMLLVVAVISLLISILLPTLAGVKEASRRANCGANLAAIHQGVINYGSANGGRIFICRGRQVQNAFNARGADVHGNRIWDQGIDWVEAMETVGLAYGPRVNVGSNYMHYMPSEEWDCPSRKYKSQWEPSYPQLVVGYQYFGGIDTWINPFVGTMQSRSPLSMKSSGEWALAADMAMKVDGIWGGGRSSAYGGAPAHQGGLNGPPIGGNQLYFNGSVSWVPFEKLIYIHAWSGGFSRIAYFFQQDLGGWDPPLGAYGQP